MNRHHFDRVLRKMESPEAEATTLNSKVPYGTEYLYKLRNGKTVLILDKQLDSRPTFYSFEELVAKADVGGEANLSSFDDYGRHKRHASYDIVGYARFQCQAEVLLTVMEKRDIIWITPEKPPQYKHARYTPVPRKTINVPDQYIPLDTNFLYKLRGLDSPVILLDNQQEYETMFYTAAMLRDHRHEGITTVSQYTRAGYLRDSQDLGYKGKYDIIACKQYGCQMAAMQALLSNRHIQSWDWVREGCTTQDVRDFRD